MSTCFGLIVMANKVGHEFYVVMVKRRDGEIYCDLAKTNERIYLDKEVAEVVAEYYDNHHVVKMVAYLDEEND
jgi:predicted GIY-YIG superfamily endonuclease